MSISDALEEALASTSVPPESAATVALARRYARLIDESAPAAKYRIPLQHLATAFEHYAATVRMTPLKEKGLEAAEVTIVNALAEHSTMSDLGPKLLAVLSALNLTLPAVGTATKPEAKRDKPQEALDAERAEAQRLKLVR